MQNAVTLEYRGRTLRGMVHVPDGGNAPFPTVLIFHGFTGNKVDSHRIHVNFSRRLEKLGIASVRYDFLGSGESDGSFDEMTLSSEVGQAAAILKSVRSDSRFDTNCIAAAGHSMGGMVAALLCGDEAAKEGAIPPERMILIAPAGNMAELVSHERELPAVRSSAGEAYDHEGFPVGEAFLDELPGVMGGAAARVAGYRGPVLVVHGSRDEAVPPEAGRIVASWFSSRVRFEEILGADHGFSSVVHEDALFGTITAFLKSAPWFRE